MVELLSQYGLFLAQVITVVVAIIIVVSALTAGRGREGDGGRVKIRHLNEGFDLLEEDISAAIADKHLRKQQEKVKKKANKKQQKADKKASKLSDPDEQAKNAKPKVYVLDYDGDVKASGHELLAKEITAVLMVAQQNDEIVVRLESPGGMVHTYGLCASQLDRIKQQQIPLTICVDKVAASGGYMMACIADKIVAAPFAIIGSIGVVATVPNFHRILKKNDVDVDIMTAGKYKRTVSMMGEITEEGRKKFIEELDDTHELFKEHIVNHRPGLDMDDVATGEHWYGSRALAKNLIDVLMTSDEYLLGRRKDAEIYSVEFKEKKTIADKIGFAAESAIERVAHRLLSGANFKRFQ